MAMLVSPACEARQDLVAGLSLVAAGQEVDGDAGGLGQGLERLEMLPRQDVGRHHQGRLAAGLDTGRHGKQGDHGLARSDIALEQADHALRRAEPGQDLAHGRVLRPGQPIGQGSEQAPGELPVAANGAAPLAAHMGAHQGHASWLASSSS